MGQGGNGACFVRAMARKSARFAPHVPGRKLAHAVSTLQSSRLMPPDSDSTSERRLLSRSWYSSSINGFLNASPDTVFSLLQQNCEFAVLPEQRDAWLYQIEFLKTQLQGITGSLHFEFNIPRMGKRIDAAILVGPVVFVVEFKIDARTFERADVDQVWDYALDLKNFHGASHSVAVVPILVATAATKAPVPLIAAADDGVFQPIAVSPQGFRPLIDLVCEAIPGTAIDDHEWSTSAYHPTPTIIEAALALYGQHSVKEIARHDAGAQNLHTTSGRLEELVSEARQRKRKIICFVTGVPGAGKTLVGLEIATRRGSGENGTHAVYLSGNAPLVAVLREALTRDEFARRKARGERVRKGAIGESVKAFIQNVHHFRDESLRESRAPYDRVVVFDEAQRAWNAQKTANFMKRRKNRSGFTQSEPELLISYMDRHPDWAVIICLVGGGQEINTGEAGVDAWIDAIATKFPEWEMRISDKLTDSEYGAGRALDAARGHKNLQFDNRLHLNVSMRSFRAENVSNFVKYVLDREVKEAKNSLSSFADKFEIRMTRDLQAAKKWVRDHARGSERYGLVASSRAQRLKPHAVDIRVDVNPVHWFLNDRRDTRSSWYLEDAATEFQVQGLELDWVCMTWDADLRVTESGWTFHDFRGDKWTRVKKPDTQQYLLNAYRVLLTRARQGMVIFVPPGDSTDPTRRPEFYDPTYSYFATIGIPTIT